MGQRLQVLLSSVTSWISSSSSEHVCGFSVVSTSACSLISVKARSPLVCRAGCRRRPWSLFHLRRLQASGRRRFWPSCLPLGFLRRISQARASFSNLFTLYAAVVLRSHVPIRCTASLVHNCCLV